MAHQPKPFFRNGRGWFVQLGKEQIKLADKPKTPATEKEAWAAFHELMANRSRSPGFSNSANPATAPTKPPLKATTAHTIPTLKSTDALTVGMVYEKFLDWCLKHRSTRTYEWAQDHIQKFCDHLKVARTMPATDLRPFHIVEWVDSRTTWGANQKRGAIVALTRPFNWAAKIGYIAVSPVRGVEKPTATKRESQMTPEDFGTILSFVKDDPFRDLITFAYEAGCRPQEARHIEARHLKLDQHRIEIPSLEAKGKKRWRVIYLSDKAEEIVIRLAATRPTGPLFLNVDNNPWKAQAIVCRFQRLLVKLAGPDAILPPLPRFDRRNYKDPAALAEAREAHQKALVARRKKMASLARKGEKRVAMYDIRHCFATRKLKEGHDPITVAALLGHKDGAMLCKHYELLSTDGEHLRKGVNSV